MAATQPRSTREPPDDSGRRGLADPQVIAAYFLLSALTGVWTWWALREGAFFEVVFLPGTLVLCGVALVLLRAAPWRADLRRSPAVMIALAAMPALGAWTLLSALWSPSPDVAVADAQRAFVCAGAFGFGLWLTHLLTRRTILALLPLAAAAALAGIVTVITVLTGDDLLRYVEEGEGTLRFPLGYRNANAAFFLIALWPAISLAAERRLDWRIRALMLGTATLCFELAVMCQSRGSVPAAAVALAVYLLLVPNRLRAVAWLGLAIAPAIAVLPTLLDVYQGSSGEPLRLAPLRSAATAAGLGSAAIVVIGALVARFEPARERSAEAVRTANRVVLIGGIAAVLACVAAFTVAVENPITWTGDRIDEFREGGTPQLENESTRFASDARSKRSDFWRVALDEVEDAPLGGSGAGGFKYRYTAERDTDRTPRDAHSVELELLSELGLPGLALFGAFAIGAGAGVLRSRRLAAPAATLSAAALASAAYWLAHASIEWFWAYPALTAPVAALLGSAAAPAVFSPQAVLGGRSRVLLSLGAVVLALSVIPPFLSQRYTDDAYRTWRQDLSGAYEDLDRARQLNPLSDTPLLADGAIAREAGDRERALRAFRRATEERPEEWAGHYFIASLVARRDPDQALSQLKTAERLNPLEPKIQLLREKILRNREKSSQPTDDR